jgi:diacylglycerol kinase family enzyme
MQLPVIANPAAGSLRGGPPDALVAHLRQAGIQPVLLQGGTIGQLARRAVEEGAPIVAAAGGDGTLSAVAAALAGTQSALGVLPLGTLNHFARDLGIPLELDAAAAALARGARRAVDVGELNGRVFINNASIGLYPAIVRQREKQRRRLGRNKWHAMLWAMHAVLRSHPFLHLRLELDGVEHRRRTPFVFVGNNAYRMEGFDIGVRERIDCGELSVYLTRRRGRFAFLALALRALVGRLHQGDDFESATVRELRIDARHRRLLVALDGEVETMDLPLRYRIRPAALQVVVP